MYYVFLPAGIMDGASTSSEYNYPAKLNIFVRLGAANNFITYKKMNKIDAEDTYSLSVLEELSSKVAFQKYLHNKDFSKCLLYLYHSYEGGKEPPLDKPQDEWLGSISLYEWMSEVKFLDKKLFIQIVTPPPTSEGMQYSFY